MSRGSDKRLTHLELSCSAKLVSSGRGLLAMYNMSTHNLDQFGTSELCGLQSLKIGRFSIWGTLFETI